MLADLPLIAWYVLVLVFLEGLLSADNALVLAVMVRHLPKPQQRRALRYGIWGAFGFRLIAVLLSSVLMRFWMFKVVGGLYLIYLALSHFLLASGDDTEAKEGSQEKSRAHPSEGRRALGIFWGTVLSVELADIAFSMDSILAAVGMADSLPDRFGHNWKLAIVYVGGVLGIITMRFVAGYFIILLDRFSGLAAAAYYLVAWIGLKLVVGGLHSATYLPSEIPGWLFWLVMALIVVAGLIERPTRTQPGILARGGDEDGVAAHSPAPSESRNGASRVPTDVPTWSQS
jgi:YkoY family integral membrane protein